MPQNKKKFFYVRTERKNTIFANLLENRGGKCLIVCGVDCKWLEIKVLNLVFLNNLQLVLRLGFGKK